MRISVRSGLVSRLFSTRSAFSDPAHGCPRPPAGWSDCESGHGQWRHAASDRRKDYCHSHLQRCQGHRAWRPNLRQGHCPEWPHAAALREIFTQCDVLPNRSIEQEHILLNVTHLLLELSGCNGVNVHIVKRNRTGVVRQPAQKQLEQSGFSAAEGPVRAYFLPFSKRKEASFRMGFFSS